LAGSNSENHLAPKPPLENVPIVNNMISRLLYISLPLNCNMQSLKFLRSFQKVSEKEAVPKSVTRRIFL